MLFHLHIVFLLLWGKPFDGIAQRCAGHCGCVEVEKTQQRGNVAFARFAEHPAVGFPHQVVGVLEQMADVAEGGVELAVADWQHCLHDGYALFPQVGAVEKAWRGVVAFHYLVAYNIWCAEVYKIPVVDAVGVREVEVGYMPFFFRVFACFLVALHERQKCRQPVLVDFAGEHLGYGLQRGVEGLFGYLPVGWHHHSDKFVAFAIFAFACLEKAAKYVGLAWCRCGA